MTEPGPLQKNWVGLARCALKEAGYPELAEHVMPSSRPGHFRYLGQNEVPYTLDRVWVLMQTWRLVHITYCRTQPVCPMAEVDDRYYREHGVNTRYYELFHNPPKLDDVLDAYEQWTRLKEYK